MVVVRGDEIEAIGPSDDTVAPSGLGAIDGRGRFLLPGLVDAHVHLGDAPSLNDALLRMFLVNGVTTVLHLCGTPEHLELRRRVSRGDVLGPQIFTSGQG